jgi:hypothetical protein
VSRRYGERHRLAQVGVARHPALPVPLAQVEGWSPNVLQWFGYDGQPRRRSWRDPQPVGPLGVVGRPSRPISGHPSATTARRGAMR